MKAKAKKKRLVTESSGLGRDGLADRRFPLTTSILKLFCIRDENAGIALMAAQGKAA
jgi:hypothetical protein